MEQESAEYQALGLSTGQSGVLFPTKPSPLSLFPPPKPPLSKQKITRASPVSGWIHKKTKTISIRLMSWREICKPLPN